MEAGLERLEPQPPQNWSELIGTVVRATELDTAVRETPGLIVLVTANGTEICPSFQFDEDETGQARVNPHVGLAWSLLKSMQVDQLGRGDWTEAGWLAQPRPEYDNRSWVDVLKDPLLTDKEKLPVYAAMVGDAVDMAGWNGDPLVDPRTILGS